MKYFKLMLLFFIIFYAFTTQAQQIETALTNVRENYAGEKIYVHYDKQVYMAGESVWFKIYLLSGFVPSMFSSSICVELINDSGRTIDKKILPVINSVAAGNFELSPDLQQANYTIRAYTRRLMNFGSPYFYHHNIEVINPSNPPAAAVQKEYSLFLLPESGNFVAGLNNTVAFKCTDQWGFPADVEGIVQNSSGQEVCKLTSTHDGMGKFSITPQKEETYTAVVTINGIVNKRVSLPAAAGSGVLLGVRTENGTPYFNVNSETVKNGDRLEPAYLLATMENSIAFRINIAEDQDNIKGVLPLNALPGGIVQLTVFNGNDEPLAERLVFNFNKDFIAAGTFSTDTVSLSPRKKNVYSFDLADSLDGDFSVAVTDIGNELATYKSDNIISRFLLTNDIKGYVNNPGYYFEGDDDIHRSHLDLVMLTNGWRKFSWKEITSKQLPQITYKDPNYISLKGLVYDEENGTPVKETNLTVYIKTRDRQNDMLMAHVDKEGQVDIPGLAFSDTATLFLMDMFAKNKKRSIQFSNMPLSKLFNAAPSSLINPLKTFTANASADNIKQRYGAVLSEKEQKTITLNEIKVTAKAKNSVKTTEDKYIRNGMFKSYALKTLDLINEPVTYSTNVFEFIKTRLTGLKVVGSAGNYFLNYRNTMSLSGGMVPMAIFLDEMQVSSTLEISTIPMTDIAMIKLYSAGFMGVEGGGSGGTLAIYTKRGDDYYRPYSGRDALGSIKVEGYSPVKEFFSPDYAPGKPSPATDDNRSTIYWDPYLQTDPGNKKFSFSFYNSDHAKKFRVVLQGMTADGKLVSIEKVIE